MGWVCHWTVEPRLILEDRLETSAERYGTWEGQTIRMPSAR